MSTENELPRLTSATLTPAYGRDYASKAAVVAAMNEKNGSVDHVLHTFQGTTYISSAGVLAAGLRTVTYRFKNQRNVMILAYRTRTVDGVSVSRWEDASG